MDPTVQHLIEVDFGEAVAVRLIDALDRLVAGAEREAPEVV